jgi:hypothetical protein
VEAVKRDLTGCWAGQGHKPQIILPATTQGDFIFSEFGRAIVLVQPQPGIE